MATYQPAKRATAWVGYISLVDQSDTKKMKSNPTIASGDFKVSKDGGALANLTTLPSVEPASSVMVRIDLSATEMTADNVTVVCIDAAGAEWCDLVFNLQPSARQIDDLAYPATSGRSMVVDANGLVDANTVKVGPSGSGTAQTAGDIPAMVTAVDDFVDTEVAAIKAKTDNLPSDPADASDIAAAFAAVNATLGTPAGASLAADVAAVKVDTAATLADTGTDGVVISSATRAAIADDVWDELLSGHAGVGSAGAALSAAGSAGDPWSTALPGAYGSGTAGKIIGDNINATISSRLASAGYTAPLDAAGTRSAVGLASANLDTQLAAIAAYIDAEVASILAAVDTEVAAIKAKTDNLPASPAAVGSAMTLTSGERDSIAAAMLDLSNGVETSITPRQALRAILASVAGVLSGAATTTITLKNPSGGTTRLTVTVDADGNRSAVVTNL